MALEQDAGVPPPPKKKSAAEEEAEKRSVLLLFLSAGLSCGVAPCLLISCCGLAIELRRS
jgi:hypothetical protein